MTTYFVLELDQALHPKLLRQFTATSEERARGVAENFARTEPGKVFALARLYSVVQALKVEDAPVEWREVQEG